MWHLCVFSVDDPFHTPSLLGRIVSLREKQAATAVAHAEESRQLKTALAMVNKHEKQFKADAQDWKAKRQSHLHSYTALRAALRDTRNRGTAMADVEALLNTRASQGPAAGLPPRVRMVRLPPSPWHWTSTHVAEWLALTCELPHAAPYAIAGGVSGPELIDMPEPEFDTRLGLRKPLHRRKLANMVAELKANGKRRGDSTVAGVAAKKAATAADVASEGVVGAPAPAFVPQPDRHKRGRSRRRSSQRRRRSPRRERASLASIDLNSLPDPIDLAAGKRRISLDGPPAPPRGVACVEDGLAANDAWDGCGVELGVSAASHEHHAYAGLEASGYRSTAPSAPSAPAGSVSPWRHPADAASGAPPPTGKDAVQARGRAVAPTAAPPRLQAAPKLPPRPASRASDTVVADALAAIRRSASQRELASTSLENEAVRTTEEAWLTRRAANEEAAERYRRWEAMRARRHSETSRSCSPRPGDLEDDLAPFLMQAPPLHDGRRGSGSGGRWRGMESPASLTGAGDADSDDVALEALLEHRVEATRTKLAAERHRLAATTPTVPVHASVLPMPPSPVSSPATVRGPGPRRRSHRSTHAYAPLLHERHLDLPALSAGSRFPLPPPDSKRGAARAKKAAASLRDMASDATVDEYMRLLRQRVDQLSVCVDMDNPPAPSGQELIKRHKTGQRRAKLAAKVDRLLWSGDPTRPGWKPLHDTITSLRTQAATLEELAPPGW